MSPGERRRLLGLLGFLSFNAVYVGVVMAPVLTQIAAEFNITTGTAGLVVAAYGVPGIAVAVLTGPYSDRFGRKRFLVTGSLIMGVFTLLSAFATSFAVLVAMRVLAGIGGSVIFPNTTATVGDNFAYRDRGSAMGTVIGLNTMAAVIGVPLAGILAEATTWRVSVGLVGVLSIAAGLLLLWKLRPAQTPLSEQGIREMYRAIVTNRSALGAIGSSFLGGLYWFTWGTYVVVFFEVAFGLSQGVASTFALTQGLGVLFGSQLGGRLGARIGHKPIVAGSVTASGTLLLLLTNLGLSLPAAAFLNLLVSAVIGARFASNTTLLTEQVPEARGTLLALSASVTSGSLVVGAAVGGLLIDGFGFWSLGVFCFAAALLAALVVTIFVREEPIDLEIASAV
ncbi:MAG TPA: MFS transporter [Candidatus Polarisedimenticolia bacterium]|nr:MFS transporter [Candidatus Polarisedimenticolia bacterium]